MKKTREKFLLNSTLQEVLDEAVSKRELTNELGKHFLTIVDYAIKKRGIEYRFSDFDVEYIIKPRIMDDLLLKCLRYTSDRGTAAGFIESIVRTAVSSGIKAVHNEKRSIFNDVYYYEDMKEPVDDSEIDESVLWDDELLSKLAEFNKSTKR